MAASLFETVISAFRVCIQFREHGCHWKISVNLLWETVQSYMYSYIALSSTWRIVDSHAPERLVEMSQDCFLEQRTSCTTSLQSLFAGGLHRSRRCSLEKPLQIFTGLNTFSDKYIFLREHLGEEWILLKVTNELYLKNSNLILTYSKLNNCTVSIEFWIIWTSFSRISYLYLLSLLIIIVYL